jgi:hypothetical protein
VTSATLLGARVERGPAALEISAPLIDGTIDGGGFRIVADRTRAYLQVAAVADFAINEGRCVRLDPHPGAQPAEVDAYLRGTVAAMLLGQRGGFALHASLVRVAGTVVAVAALPGVGKSTTALRLEQRGHELVGDDFAELRPEADGVAYTTLERAVHVTPETATALGIDTVGAHCVNRTNGKLALPARPVASGRLEAVAVLSPGDGEHAAARERLTASRALVSVFGHGFRFSMAKLLWPKEAFAWAAAVSARLPVYAVTRPREGWTVDAVADEVEAIATETRSAGASRL